MIPGGGKGAHSRRIPGFKYRPAVLPHHHHLGALLLVAGLQRHHRPLAHLVTEGDQRPFRIGKDASFLSLVVVGIHSLVGDDHQRVIFIIFHGIDRHASQRQIEQRLLLMNGKDTDHGYPFAVFLTHAQGGQMLGIRRDTGQQDIIFRSIPAETLLLLIVIKSHRGPIALLVGDHAEGAVLVHRSRNDLRLQVLLPQSGIAVCEAQTMAAPVIGQHIVLGHAEGRGGILQRNAQFFFALGADKTKGIAPQHHKAVAKLVIHTVDAVFKGITGKIRIPRSPHSGKIGRHPPQAAEGELFMVIPDAIDHGAQKPQKRQTFEQAADLSPPVLTKFGDVIFLRRHFFTLCHPVPPSHRSAPSYKGRRPGPWGLPAPCPGKPGSPGSAGARFCAVRSRAAFPK